MCAHVAMMLSIQETGKELHVDKCIFGTRAESGEKELHVLTTPRTNHASRHASLGIANGRSNKMLLRSLISCGADGLCIHEDPGHVRPERQARLYCRYLASAMRLQRDEAVEMGKPYRGTWPIIFFSYFLTFQVIHSVSSIQAK
jgi:hypothetical protein